MPVLQFAGISLRAIDLHWHALRAVLVLQFACISLRAIGLHWHACIDVPVLQFACISLRAIDLHWHACIDVPMLQFACISLRAIDLHWHAVQCQCCNLLALACVLLGRQRIGTRTQTVFNPNEAPNLMAFPCFRPCNVTCGRTRTGTNSLEVSYATITLHTLGTVV